MGKLDLWQRLELPGEGLPGETLVEIMGDGPVTIVMDSKVLIK